MIIIPPGLLLRFNTLLVEKSIPGNHHNHYRKWLRYYLDFCKKYRFPGSQQESLPHFIKKLQDKHQTQGQQKQALHTVSLYYELVESGSSKNPPLPTGQAGSFTKEKLMSNPGSRDRGVLTRNNESKPVKKEDLTFNKSWESAYTNLCTEIKTRHYSPKTLKTYALWIRQFQTFNRSKDPKLLSSSDVKKFLSFLAVKRKVSVSTQNQAFNALLFFYRHSIKKDFGEHKDIVRAKRKPYIPVVLSREEALAKVVIPVETGIQSIV